MANGRHLEKSKNVVLMDITNSLLKTGNKTANINVKYCSLHTLLTAMDRSVVNIANPVTALNVRESPKFPCHARNQGRGIRW